MEKYTAQFSRFQLAESLSFSKGITKNNLLAVSYSHCPRFQPISQRVKAEE